MRMKEARDIIISSAVLALAFGIALSGGIEAIANPELLTNNIAMAMVAVSLSFVLHELGHRAIAKKYECFAEYQMWPFGLLLALAVSMTGFVFAAPGAVFIHQKIDLWGNVSRLSKKKIGLISISGPLINLALAGIFVMANALLPLEVFRMGTTINLWLAIFNALPIGPLDGSKIFQWDKRIWLAFFVPTIIFFAASIFYI